jgi:hypothetical protein
MSGIVHGYVQVPFELENGAMGRCTVRAVVPAGDDHELRLSVCGTVTVLVMLIANGFKPTICGKEVR